MTPTLTDYEALETSSDEERRLVRQEELILEVTEALAEALEREGISKAELARRLRKTKGFVSQVLGGGRNLTLRTIADIADAFQCRMRVYLERAETLHHALAQQIEMPLESPHPTYRIVQHRFPVRSRVTSRAQVAA